MHPKSDQRSEYIKTTQGPDPENANPLSIHLSKTGLDLEDLSVVSCINHHVLKDCYYHSTTPNDRDIAQIETCLELSSGSLLEEYKEFELNKIKVL